MTDYVRSKCNRYVLHDMSTPHNLVAWSPMPVMRSVNSHSVARHGMTIRAAGGGSLQLHMRHYCDHCCREQ